MEGIGLNIKKCQLCDDVATWINLSCQNCDKELFLFCELHVSESEINHQSKEFNFNKKGWGEYEDLQYAFYPIN